MKLIVAAPAKIRLSSMVHALIFAMSLGLVEPIRGEKIVSFMPLSKYTKIELENFFFRERVDSAPSFNFRWMFPAPHNLNNILTPFSEQNCATHIDNFFLTNIPKVESPVYFRTPELAVYEKSWVRYPKLAWMPGASVKNVSVCDNYEGSDEWMLDGLLSYNIFPTREQYLLRSRFPILHPISFLNHSVHTKPWNCQVHILLYPPTELLSRQYWFPPVTWYPLVSTDLSRQIASATPVISFMIIDVTVQPDVDEETFVRRFFRPAMGNGNLYNHLLLATNISLSSEKNVGDLAPTKGFIDRTVIYQFCSVCARPKSGLYIAGAKILPIRNQDLRSVRKIAALAFPDYHDAALMWYLDLSEEPRTTRFSTKNTLVHLERCRQEPSFVIASLSPMTLAARHAQAKAHVWSEIMKNYTIPMPNRGSNYNGLYCINGKEVRVYFKYFYYYLNLFTSLRRKILINEKDTRVKYPVVTSDKFSSLQFVSCGRRGTLDYPFHQLTDVYDIHVWVLLALLCFGAFPVMLHIFMGRHFKTELLLWSTLHHALTAWKVLFEQGDRFMQRGGSGALRLGTGVFILCGIILSNSYTNSNVYDMIAPREAVPYETLAHLIQDKFTIYSRIGSTVITDLKFYRPNDLVLRVFRHEVHDRNSDIVSGYSDVAILQNKDGENNSEIIEKLYNHSQIHKFAEQQVLELVEMLAFYYRKRVPGKGKNSKPFTSNF